MEEQPQNPVDGVRILENLSEIGRKKNYIGSRLIRSVVLPAQTVSEVVFRQHVLVRRLCRKMYSRLKPLYEAMLARGRHEA